MNDREIDLAAKQRLMLWLRSSPMTKRAIQSSSQLGRHHLRQQHNYKKHHLTFPAECTSPI
jgi:hypothetical protein